MSQSLTPDEEAAVSRAPGGSDSAATVTVAAAPCRRPSCGLTAKVSVPVKLAYGVYTTRETVLLMNSSADTTPFRGLDDTWKETESPSGSVADTRIGVSMPGFATTAEGCADGGEFRAGTS